MEKRILILKNAGQMDDGTKLLLEKASLGVDIASSMRDALRRVDTANYGAVIAFLDVHYPNGIWFLDFLMRERPQIARVLVADENHAGIAAHMASGKVEYFVSIPAPNIGEFMRTVFNSRTKTEREGTEIIGILPSNNSPLKWANWS